ncbi:D-arabitol-phosphate dehydrogenase, partial [Enterococcus sp. 12E11_DIV0728]
QQNGSMANYVLAREESIHVLPDHLSYEGAAMSCLLYTSRCV